MFILVHCIGRRDDDDVAKALATTCVANTKLKGVQILDVLPLPVMKSLATRQVPLEELKIIPPEIHTPWVC